MTIIEIKNIVEPILKKHQVTRAGIFGSYAIDKQTNNSDVDILVKIDKKISLLEFVKIKLEIEDKIGKKVDLVEYSSIKPRLKENILSEEVRLYG